MSDLQPVPLLSEEKTYCEKHPNRETSLRCNKCGRLMCVDCAVSTPVGYRCKECVRGIQATYFTGTDTDSVLIFGSSAAIGVACGILASLVMISPIFIIILGLPVGGALAAIPIRLVEKRRGRHFADFGAAGAVVGGLIGIAVHLFLLSSFRGAPVRLIMSEFGTILFSFYLSPLILTGMVAAAIYGRLKMRS